LLSWSGAQARKVGHSLADPLFACCGCCCPFANLMLASLNISFQAALPASHGITCCVLQMASVGCTAEMPALMRAALLYLAVAAPAKAQHMLPHRPAAHEVTSTQRLESCHDSTLVHYCCLHPAAAPATQRVQVAKPASAAQPAAAPAQAAA
jgi:hypothetical protein